MNPGGKTRGGVSRIRSGAAGYERLAQNVVPHVFLNVFHAREAAEAEAVGDPERLVEQQRDRFAPPRRQPVQRDEVEDAEECGARGTSRFADESSEQAASSPITQSTLTPTCTWVGRT
ncbi:hypothetical protein OO015_11785 [Thermomicrobium sp. 4228-Ro]|uniref:hypothetical protein n=1 Tax=Thermomicrobium sp. 4228-Ro TaxID=2993937 RepID=UPI0022495AFF|nr:hypothetical protein [Thermomicrobium sp. 4228-Ro]MCX2728171.1 hypothetical protein [Thermomicrobium sp. 4228-Ro]